MKPEQFNSSSTQPGAFIAESAETTADDSGLPQPENSVPLGLAARTIRSFTTSDGYELHFRYWQPVHCRGIVVALHGIQSHSGWYEYSSNAMCQAGFAVYFADRRGSGLNTVDRGHADHGLRLINDVRQLIDIARNEHNLSSHDTEHEPVTQPRSKLTLMGISWGGKIAAAIAALYPKEINALALLYPGLTPRISPNRWQLLRLNLARHFDIRHKSVPIPLGDPALFTSTQHWQEAIKSDPLALHCVTSGFLNSGRDLDSFVHQHSSAITHSTLLMLAGRDTIINNQSTRRLVAQFGVRRLLTILYPNARHTLEFEPDRSQFVADLVCWLNESPRLPDIPVAATHPHPC